jgi:very-short-patch-repair endonuclease
LAAEQDDVVSRRQLRALGIDRRAVMVDVGAGRWQTVGLQVVVLHNGPLTTRQRYWVGVLHAGRDAVLCAASALCASGVAIPEPSVVHVAVRRGSHARDLDDHRVNVRVHELRRTSADDVHPALMPPRHRVPRATLDAATMAPTPDAVRALVCAVVQQRHATVAALSAAVDRSCRVRHRGIVRQVLADIDGGSESLPELQFLRIVRRAGLPLPSRQVRVRRADGSWYLDVVWERFGLVVEVDGAQHYSVLHREADAARDRELAIQSRQPVRFSSWIIRRDPLLVAATLERLLESRGWQRDRELGRRSA